MKKKDARIDITVFGAVINILLSFAKIGAGVIAKSRALVADGLHSLSDLVSDVIVIFGIIYGDRPSDDDHPYGHKKIETAAEIALSLILAAVAFYIAFDAFLSLFKPPVKRVDSIVVVIVAFVSVIVKEYLYKKTIAVGKKYDSPSIIANAWHHRSDALSSIPVLIGLIVIRFFPQLYFLDAALGIIIALMILKVALPILFNSFKSIIDTAPAAEVKQKIIEIIKNDTEIKDFHNLRMRMLGNCVFVDTHILVDKNLTVEYSHNIAHRLKKNIIAECGNICEVLIHIEPDN